VVDKCGLKPIGVIQVQGVHGVAQAETFVVNLRLPNQLGIPQMTVTRGELGVGADVLIGMDIIGHGDFSITCVGGNTVFSFRYHRSGQSTTSRSSISKPHS
jgi:hypothetical protein